MTTTLRPTRTAPRERLSPEARRARLLETGLELFGEASYDALSTDDIAERGGVSRGLLFHYFGSKRGYYVAVIQEAADRLLERSKAAEDGPKPDAGLGWRPEQLDVFLEFVESNAGLFTLLMQSGVGVDPQIKEIVDECRRVLTSRVAPRPSAGRTSAGRTSAGRTSADRTSAGRTSAGHTSAGHTAEGFAVTAWIGAVEAAAVEWADGRRRGDLAVDRRRLVELLTEMLPSTLRVSAPTPDPR